SKPYNFKIFRVALLDNKKIPCTTCSYSFIYTRKLRNSSNSNLYIRLSHVIRAQRISHWQIATYSSTTPSTIEETFKKNVPGRSSWLYTYLPPKLVPYALLARLDKPIGTWLLYLPCTWSITMATYHAQLPVSQAIYMLTLFGVGAFIMRGAGCTINDLWDKKIDKLVERTQNRPIASGAVTPFQAITFLGLQLSAGLTVLTQLNYYSKDPVLCVKRLLTQEKSPGITKIKRLAFNWGALLGWPAMIGNNEWSVTLPLYFAGICWTLVYDTIYAHQDKDFDSAIGVKSTALLFGDNTRLWLSFFSGSMVTFLFIAGQMNDHNWPFYSISVLGTGIHLAWQLRTVNFNDVVDCDRKFRNNKWVGVLVLSGILADIAWKVLNNDQSTNVSEID
ncbi:37386_t:CDS:2, partial [Gigaspora margarita]